MIDGARGRAYANLWTDTTLAIDLHKRTVVARWKNGCNGSRGLALDPARGFLFVGCKEGKLESLSLSDGHHLGEVSSGDGVDIIAYAPSLHHAYLPGAASATMAVVGISSSGKADRSRNGTHRQGQSLRDRGRHQQCLHLRSAAGQLLIFHDSLPATSE